MNLNMEDVVVFVNLEIIVFDMEMDNRSIWWMNHFLF